MQNWKLSRVPAAAALMLVLSGATTTGMAQTPAPVRGKMPPHAEAMKGMQGMQDMQDMQGMAGMSAMMKGAHHVLAMAYRDNVVTFAQALRAHVAQSKAVDLDLARPAVAELRRSFEQMQQHHKAHAAMAGGMMRGEPMAGDKTLRDTMMHERMKAGHATSPMPDMMQGMDMRLAALNEHLTALESELNADAPEPAKVSAHTTAIVQQCAALFAMPTKMKPKHGN